MKTSEDLWLTDVVFPNILGECIRRGVTLRALAKLSHVRYKALRAWLCGRGDMPASALVAMARFFQCSSDYLFRREE